MKKELLLATTIAGLTMGATSASAVTGTMGGNNRVGILDVDRNSSTATTGTTNSNIQSSFSVSLDSNLNLFIPKKFLFFLNKEDKKIFLTF